MMQHNERVPSLEFGNLPLVEVIARYTFEPAIKLTFGLVNSLHEALRDDFPDLSELEGIENPPGLTGQAGFQFPSLPGASYVGRASATTISLHAHLLSIRWRRQIMSDAPPYPRFRFLQDKLRKAVRELERLVPGAGLPITVVNMVYVNLIQPRDPKTVLGDYFAKDVQIAVAESADPLHELVVSWRQPNNVDLRFHLQAATAQVGEEQRTGYRLATAAGTRLNSHLDADGALGLVHDCLQTFFVDVISGRAKEEWELKVL